MSQSRRSEDLIEVLMSFTSNGTSSTERLSVIGVDRPLLGYRRRKLFRYKDLVVYTPPHNRDNESSTHYNWFLQPRYSDLTPIAVDEVDWVLHQHSEPTPVLKYLRPHTSGERQNSLVFVKTRILSWISPLCSPILDLMSSFCLDLNLRQNGKTFWNESVKRIGKVRNRLTNCVSNHVSFTIIMV